MLSLNVFTKQEWTVGEIKLDKGLAASVPGILFTLKDNTPPFQQMLALQGQGNNRAISFTNRYLNMS